MPRLLRPHIPLKVRCVVVLRQLGEMWPDSIIAYAVSHKRLLDDLLIRLAALLGCEVGDLDLDHDPPLGAREKVFNRKREHVEYKPTANDPDHLFYRVRRAHKIKTNVRGDGAQHPDRVLIKKNRRIEEAQQAGKKPAFVKARAKMKKPKTKWPKRPMQSNGGWGKKGQRK